MQPGQYNEESKEEHFDVFKRALMVSRMDKVMMKKEKSDQSEQKDFHKYELNNNGKSSVYFSTIVPQDANADLNTNDVEDSSIIKSLIQNQLSFIENEPTLPYKEGFLFKKSPHLLQGWQKRFCKVTDKVLRYYKLDQLEYPFGTLNFDLVTYEMIEVFNSNGGIIEFTLKPKNHQKIFHFKADNQPATAEWAKIIKEHLQASKGHQTHLYGLCQYQRFWRTDRIDASSVMDFASTGDVLLFRGNSANCILQRSFTGAEYDHAALLLRFVSGAFYIFEATGYYGVGLCPWSIKIFFIIINIKGEFMEEKYYDCYDKVVLRHLDIQRDKEFVKKIQEFMNQNLGKKYGLNPAKLFKLKSSIKDVQKDANSAQKQEERTFFCSELVAACYKHLGLLPQEIASTQYWPGNFASKANLKLLKGRLSQEFLIDFSAL